MAKLQTRANPTSTADCGDLEKQEVRGGEPFCFQHRFSESPEKVTKVTTICVELNALGCYM
jgi:hypothetical protein